MKSIYIVTKEVMQNLIIIHRISLNELIVKNKGNVLGVLWLWINPTIQLVIYALVFGENGIRGGNSVGGIPFFYWLLPGFIMWNYISGVVTTGSRSIVAKIGLVTKMKFPVSVIPAVVILSELYIHILMVITMVLIIIPAGYPITMYWWNVLYFAFAATCLLYSLSLFNSALTTVIRDYQHVVYNVMRAFFFVTPVVFPTGTMKGVIAVVVKANPFTYLVSGYRDSFVLASRTTFMSYRWGMYYWFIVIALYIVGSILHVKMRKNLLDYA